MSQYPRLVLAPGCWVADGVHSGGLPPVMIWVKGGTLIDAPPGGRCEQLYGAGNLSPVIGPRDSRRAPESCDDLSKEALGN